MVGRILGCIALLVVLPLPIAILGVALVMRGLDCG